MVKGYQRRVIVVKGADQGTFESAYFVLRREEEERNTSREELMAQAELMVAQNSLPERDGSRLRRRGQKIRYFLMFLLGLLTGVGATLLVRAIF